MIEQLIAALDKFMDAVESRLKSIETTARIPGPAGERGEKGEPGEKGEAGIHGEPGPAGRDGADGKDGAPGERGERGEKGEAGERGEQGLPGLNGKDGPAGERGEKGADGRDGRDGKDGKDGVASIDQLKAMIAEEVERALPPAVEKSVAEMFDRWPKMQYRGVYREGEAYSRGDFVTWGGSMWHCNDAGTIGKPGIDGSWEVAVKKGDKGRDRDVVRA